MKYVFFDVETTGLTRQDEVIQFSAFVTDEDLKLLEYCNFYCYTQVPINPKAQSVHGIDAKKLRELSGGLTFEDQFLKLSFIYEDDLVWVGYSTSGFDNRMVNQTLTNNGLEPYNFGSKCRLFREHNKGRYVMDFYNSLRIRCRNGRDCKLQQLVTELGDCLPRLHMSYTKLCGVDASFHDACYDAYMLWIIAMVYKRKLGLDDIH